VAQTIQPVTCPIHIPSYTDKQPYFLNTIELNMQSKPHGDYTLEWQGEVLHAFPRGNFNEYGIIALKHAVLNNLAGHTNWVLFERPSNKAGIIPEAINELAKAFAEYQQQGCILIIIEVPAVFGAAIKAEAAKHSDIPVIYDTDPLCLAQIAQDTLNSSH
jgi:hypothetical protein